MRKLTKILIPAAVLLGGAAVIGGYIYHANAPKRALEAFLKDVQNGRYERAYEKLILPEEALLDEACFERIFEGDPAAEVEFSVKELKTDIEVPDNGGRIYAVSASEDAADTDSAEDICSGTKALTGVYEMMKSGGFLTGSWKIVPIDMVVRNAQLESFAEGTAYVDGICLTEDNCNITQYEYMKNYTIPYLFTGAHMIREESKCFEPAERRIELSGNETYIGSAQYTLSEESCEYISFYTDYLLTRTLDNVGNGRMPLDEGSAMINEAVSKSLSLAGFGFRMDDAVYEPENLRAGDVKIETVGISEQGPYIETSQDFEITWNGKQKQTHFELGKRFVEYVPCSETTAYRMKCMFVYREANENWYYASLAFEKL